jgi:DNA-binding NarL/FixJ family response regulator
MHVSFGWMRTAIRPRLLLADDNHELLEAEIALLQPHFELVGTASDGPSLVSEAQRLNPDVIVADITLPVLNGIDAVHKLKKSGSNAKIVFLTIHTGEEYVNACLQEGARGYVWKSRMKAHLIPAIYAVLEDLPYVSPLTSS